MRRFSGVRSSTMTLRAGALGSFLCSSPDFLRGPGGPDYKGDGCAADHDRRDDVEGEGVTIGGVYDAGDQDRPEHPSHAPGRKHEAVVRPDVRRTEVVGVEGRHRPEAATVAGDYDEGEHCQQEVRVD